MATKVFISYRRQDSDAHALSIAQYLQSMIGAGNVFIDVDRIRPGERFPAILESHLKQSDHMLVVIGPSWLSAADDAGNRRLDNPEDWVRLEIERALARGIPIIPVCVGGAALPSAANLPQSLRPLLSYHAVSVTTASFRHVMPGLARDLGLMGKRKMPWLGPTAALILIVGGGVAAVVWRNELEIWVRSPEAVTGSADRPAGAVASGRADVKAPPGGPCAQLKAIIAESDNDFFDVRLEPLRNKVWSSRLKLDGYESCTINELQNVAMICSTGKVESKEIGRSRAQAAAKEAVGCLGSGWQSAALTDDFVGVSHLGSRHAVIFAVQENAELSPQLELVQTHVNTVMIYRDRPKQGPPSDMIAADKPSGYCASLKRVIAASANRFGDIMKAKQGGHYLTTIGLEGWFGCRIYDLGTRNAQPRYYYSCELSPFPDAAATENMMQVISDDVKQCLGPEWSSRKRRNNHDGKLVVEWEASNVPADVELRQRKGLHGQWEILLDVNLR